MTRIDKFPSQCTSNHQLMRINLVIVVEAISVFTHIKLMYTEIKNAVTDNQGFVDSSTKVSTT